MEGADNFSSLYIRAKNKLMKFFPNLGNKFSQFNRELFSIEYFDSIFQEVKGVLVIFLEYYILKCGMWVISQKVEDDSLANPASSTCY